MSFLALSALAAAVSATPPARYAQVVIEQRTVVRIRPILAPPPNANVQRQRWVEKKGPGCIRTNSLAGALISSTDSVDLILRGGARLRARLEKSCSSIDFYQGFYVKPSKDGQICQDRDLIRSRVGGECQIQDFRLLVPGK
jgi:hypothetical protein